MNLQRFTFTSLVDKSPAATYARKEMESITKWVYSLVEGLVGKDTTVNGKQLTASITLSLDDVIKQNTSTVGTLTGTLTNCPVAGNPAGYLKVKIAGVDRVIPYWNATT